MFHLDFLLFCKALVTILGRAQSQQTTVVPLFKAHISTMGPAQVLC